MPFANQDMHPSPSGAKHSNEGIHLSQPSTPEPSQLSTPKMSQHNARAVILDTPPLILNTFASLKYLPSAPSFDSDHTPTSLDDQYRYPLEPPAWKPPERDEIEHIDAWNNTYNNQHHYLNGYSYNKDDSSTICSSQTNNSLSKSYGSRDKPGQQILRPRGFSINSHGSIKGTHFRHPSFGSCPQQPPRHGQKQHHRHDSLPVALFSSTSITQSLQHSSQQHPLLAQMAQQEVHDKRKNARTYKMIQPRKQNGPYEIHSHQHASQVRADATMAGLTGALIDLYAVDRSVDEATAKMLAVSAPDKKRHGEDTHSRKTSVGTLDDIQTILELHRVDKMVDKFKQGLQMPVFFEEEARDVTILKELRRVDLLIGGVHKKADIKSTVHENAEQKQYQFDLSEDDDDDEGESWDQLGGGHGGIYLSTDSFNTEPEPDPYQFYDPHETAAMASNAYQHSFAATSQDDLHEVMDLLRCDVEVDGASRRQKELKFVQPLLEVDRSMDRWRVSVMKRRCEKEMLDLYLVDIEVNGAKRRVETKSHQQDISNCEKVSVSEHILNEGVKKVNFVPTPNTTNQPTTLQSSDDHSPQICQPPPPSVTPDCTKRSIFPHREKLNNNVSAVSNASGDMQVPAGRMRSIFTEQEKTQGN
jgi:hypothetical protein